MATSGAGDGATGGTEGIEVVERRGTLEVVRLAGLAPCVDAVVTTRVGGVSVPPYDTLNLGDHVGDRPDDVAENRARLAAAMGVAGDELLFARQVHGEQVSVVSRGTTPGDADVLVTTDEGVAVGILVADCVPIVALDPVAHVLGVAHAGWRGTAARVAVAMLDAMVALGAAPGRCLVAMGPCVSARTYQVGPEVVGALREAGCGDAVAPDGTGRHLADLAGACHSQLIGAAVPASQVALPTSWTDGGARFFSDRAQRPCGRFALVARLAGRGS